MKFGLFISSIFFTLITFGQVNVQHLRCEQLTNPIGTGILKPRLSWQLTSAERGIKQTHYHILVASSKELLEKNNCDVWNSGKLASSESVLIPFAGKTLLSNKMYYWKVKSFTNKGESLWSEINWWQTGLLSQSGWKAKWIGYDNAFPWDSVSQWSRLSARYFRKQFQSAGNIKQATLNIVGLGLYELFVNGKRIGDQVLAPAPTDYRKSVLSNTFDVTAQLNNGENSLAVVLGNGRFFTMRQNYKTHKHNNFGFPKLLLQLDIEYVDGKKKTIISDESWKFTADGPIRTNNEYDGEEYDATKELTGWNLSGFDDRKWLKPKLVKAPQGKIVSQMNPPMRIMKIIKPVTIKKLRDSVHILDMGQNFAGWLQLSVSGKRGHKVKMRFSESLQPNGELYVANLRDARVTNIYTLKGDGVETWHPAFVYHGFRYVEISGYPGEPAIDDFEGQLIFDDMQTIGKIETSNPVINNILKNSWWGIASNYKGMPVDCPQRNERQPWLGDRAQGAFGESFLFNNATLYAKWLDDIEQSQRPDGAIPDVAPAFWNYYSDNVTWPGTYILVADMLHRQFGDKQSIRKHYASMKKWMQYIRSKYMKGFIVTKDQYGDWCVPPESLEMIRSRDSTRTTKGELISTAYYYHLLGIMSRFAKIADKGEDVKTFQSLAENIKLAFNRSFFNSKTAGYDNGTITANLLPLYFGMVPEGERQSVFQNIYKKLQKDNMHISTGVIGTQWLMRALTENEKPGAAFTLASNKTYPSWGYMIENGATTIWELWNGNTANPQMNSQNHIMLLGDLLIWMYENLAGFQASDRVPAFKQITMKPSFGAGLSYVKSSYQSPYGEMVSDWSMKDNELVWNINIPANASAVVYIPAKNIDDITEAGKKITTTSGIKFLKYENNNVVVELGSGKYMFGVEKKK